MHIFRIFIALSLASLLLTSCDLFEDDDDDGGTSAGSGTVEQSTSKTADTTDTASTDSVTTTSQTTSSQISLNAFQSFSCTSNWSNRDGALGLTAHTGSGTCFTTFPGKSGSYQITLIAQTEFDGRSPYQISINDQVVSAGSYPLSSSLYCDCPLDQWYIVCPDRNVTIDAGIHAIKTGDKISFWGDQVYPCGDHGSYAKWHGMTFTPAN
ncbi:hypothetical protein [Desulfofustis glycolicus]|uniref:Uncharacterized protein n=1 Tax=Desulfofustis glycolicus DSM 9705 TaxID=1121409 RepID=A0A1M5VB63_9BACT|nr:hypothetical protein [Desulfofustis glycolicus]MCB2218235.1 hypothetical protein [Desulfobulbaceae bacterium]SHH72446.1 hypothetical protein SAMN02745124_01630 [Desulfofustis glycolicus DSM 9705]